MLLQIKAKKYWQNTRIFGIELKPDWKINDKPGEFGKIKFDLDDDLPLNKILKLHGITVAVWFVFLKGNKFYPQVFLNECLYKL